MEVAMIEKLLLISKKVLKLGHKFYQYMQYILESKAESNLVFLNTKSVYNFSHKYSKYLQIKLVNSLYNCDNSIKLCALILN